MKPIFYAILLLFAGCIVDNSMNFKNMGEFKKRFKHPGIDTIEGNFEVIEYDSLKVHYKFNNTDDYSIYCYSASGVNDFDTIVINNTEYPLGNSNNIFVDTTYKNVILRELDGTTIYKIKDKKYNYLLFDSYPCCPGGRGINLRFFVVFYIENDSIVDYKVFSSWFGDANNFIVTEKGDLDFIQMSLKPYEGRDTCTTCHCDTYGLKFINVATLEERKEKYKVLETFDCKKDEYNYKFEKYVE